MLPWSVTQKYDLSKPPLVTSGLTPPQASVGDRVGGIIIANSSFALSSTFNSNSFMMKCFRFKIRGVMIYSNIFICSKLSFRHKNSVLSFTMPNLRVIARKSSTTNRFDTPREHVLLVIQRLVKCEFEDNCVQATNRTSDGSTLVLKAR